MTKENELVATAQNGSQAALEGLVRVCQDRVHRLAMRMLVNPDDAQEATQEILILVVTKLSTFKGESAFNTWLYRVATNYLLTARKIKQRELGLTFDMFAEDLESGLVDPAPPADDVVMLNELRMSCTMAMLLCLDQKHRIAYVLGDILELDHGEAADILDISSANFRQRLSRARRQVVDFTASRCGLANKNAKCSCPRRLPAALKMGRVDRAKIRFAAADAAPAYQDVVAMVEKVEGQLKALKLQTAMPSFASPQDFGSAIARMVDGETH